MGGMLGGGLERRRRRAGVRLRSGLSPAVLAAAAGGGGRAMCFARKILHFPRSMG